MTLRRLSLLIAFEAATLAVVSFLHLAGIGSHASGVFSPSGAGTAEGLLCVVLTGAVVALRTMRDGGREVALGAVGFTIVGFLFGLSFTLRGGSPGDVAYHLAMLPLLAGTFVLLLRRRADRSPSA